MAPTSKSPEDWVNFLLALIDHTKDFKPDWEGFAQNTGLYKRGKFVQQAYNGLRKKQADGHFDSGGTLKSGSNATVPKTPGAKGARTGHTSKKRKVDDDDDGGDNARDDDHNPDSKMRRTKKRKTSTSVSAATTGRSSTFGEESDEGKDIEVIEVKDDDVLDSIEAKQEDSKKIKVLD